MPDPLARHSRFLFWAFGWYLRWLFWRRFNGVRVARSGLPAVAAGRPVIICSNHPSWWDPAFFILLQTMLFPGRRGFGPMDAAALGKYRLLERMGVFGIELERRRGAVQFLEVCSRVLSEPGSVLWITAQGEFADVRAPIKLRPGIGHLLRRVPEATVLPLAMEYGFWNEGKPEALARFGAAIDAGRERSVAEWVEELEGALTRTAAELAADSVRRDPRLFVRLVRGSAAVGPIYGAYRRLRAMATGQKIDASHGGGE